MTMTARRPRQARQPRNEAYPTAPVEAPLLDFAEQQGQEFTVPEQSHLQAADRLQEDCMKVSFSVGGLPSSKRVDNRYLDALVDSTGGNRRGFSASKRLWPSRHPAVQAISQAKRAIEKWRDGHTIPMAASGAEIENEDGATISKSPGVRLISTKDIESFEAGLSRLSVDLGNAVASLCEQYDDVLRQAREDTGDAFRREDYMTQDELRQHIKLLDRRYDECNVSFRLPANIRDQLVRQYRDTLNRSLEVAITDIGNNFRDTFADLAKQLVDRRVIRPRAGHRLAYLADAEIWDEKTHADDESIPEGHVKLMLKPKGATLKDAQWFDPMPVAEVERDLRPILMDKTRKLSESVVDRLSEQLRIFTEIKDKLGPYGAHIDGALGALRDLLHPKGYNAQSTIRELKQSEFYRREMRIALDSASTAMSETITEASRVRRRISMDLVGQA